MLSLAFFLNYSKGRGKGNYGTLPEGISGKGKKQSSSKITSLPLVPKDISKKDSTILRHPDIAVQAIVYFLYSMQNRLYWVSVFAKNRSEQHQGECHYCCSNNKSVLLKELIPLPSFFSLWHMLLLCLGWFLPLWCWCKCRRGKALHYTIWKQKNPVNNLDSYVQAK